ncbi:MAG TPA: Flp pilus assembly protein CpaB [Vicinamibacterales bacterium]|nr:Flp pilus assembly protein CpaB [Vicinamibacterales bacterium]
MKVRPLIVLALALSCALLAVFLARSWILDRSTNPVAEAAPAQTVQVVAAATVLKFGDRLAKENLRLIDWPAGSVPEGTFKTVDELLGPQPRVALQAIQPNELVLANKVTGPGQRASLSTVISAGMRAMTIRVNDVLGVAGFILPGDRVDIMLTREIVKDQPITDVLLQNVKVLGIDQRSEQQDNKPDVVKAVTIEVTTEQAQKITLASRVGMLSLALRDVSNVELAPVKPVSLKDLGISEAIGTVEPKPEDKKIEMPVVKIVPKKPENALPSIGITRGTARQEYKVTPEGTVVQPIGAPEPAKEKPDEVPAPPTIQNPVAGPSAALTSF